LAISSGGLTGKGYLKGTFTKLNYVPEQTTDFIFSSIGEEQGFIGSVAVVFLFLILIIRLVQRGEDSKHLFIKNYAYAIAGFIFLHFFINIGMTMGISPVIGIPLPFISKGGSSLMAFSIMIGVALKMFKER
jgi:rod shape determining protein RodA